MLAWLPPARGQSALPEGVHDCCVSFTNYNPFTNSVYYTCPTSPLGSVDLDGRGNYSVSSKSGGKYAVNGDVITFTGGELSGWPAKYIKQEIRLAPVGAAIEKIGSDGTNYCTRKKASVLATMPAPGASSPTSGGPSAGPGAGDADEAGGCAFAPAGAGRPLPFAIALSAIALLVRRARRRR